MKQILLMSVIAWGLLEFEPFLFPSFHTKTDMEVHAITCSDHYAVELPNLDPYFPGAYVKCEDIDFYFDAVGRKDMDAAQKLLLTNAPANYDKSKKWGK